MRNCNMKIALFLATKKGYQCLESLINSGISNNIGFVTSFKETNVVKSYDEDIIKLCKKNNIKYLNWKELKDDLFSFLSYFQISVSFAIGWKYLIDTKINDVTDYGLIVFHDSLLPKYKGFAPTPTAIICGETTIGVSAIQVAEGIDDGDIILQKSMKLTNEEYISEIIDRQCDLYSDMIAEIIDLIDRNSLVFTPQDESKATYSVWRNPEDCHIDWSKNSQDIYNLIRAVSTPYPGAFTYYKGAKIIINKASIVPDIAFAIRDYGKLWNISDNKATVICGKGLIRIDNATYENGDIVFFDKLRERLI